MKQCPACKTNYTDDSLSFCLADGAALDSATDEQPTVIKKAGNKAMQVDIGSMAASTVMRPAAEPIPKGSAGTWIKIALGTFILGVLAIGAVGLIGAVFYYGSGGKEKEITAKSPMPTATATPDTEKERLRDELANIQKKLAERQKTNINTNTFPSDNDDDHGSKITATVNSPNDGFLALRSVPNAERGDRIARIPHGTEVELNNCEKTQVTIAGRSGRWCQVEYNSRTGWVFDAWLEY